MTLLLVILAVLVAGFLAWRAWPQSEEEARSGTAADCFSVTDWFDVF